MNYNFLFMIFNSIAMLLSLWLMISMYRLNKKTLNVLKSIERNTKVVKTDILLKRAASIRAKAAAKASDQKQNG